MSYARTDSGGRGGRGGRRGGGGSFAGTVRPVAGGGAPGGPTGFRRGLPAAPDLSGIPNAPAPRSAGRVPSMGGGGGGGGVGGFAVDVAARPVQTLEDYIQNHFLLKQTEQEAARGLEDFDAQTMKMQQDTEAEQGVATQDLERALADQGRENAGSFAARGLERSGLVFQEQDRINEQGVQGKSRIQQMLSDLLANRGQGRIEAERNNQQRINDRIAQIAEEFNQRNMGQIGV